LTIAGSTSIAVVGPGAVGGLLAALLRRHGLAVTAVGAGTVRTINQEGIANW